uniref:UBC core domain-containing protein n=1 Tax=Heterorhabditis bacteriophora TaxID=37862 RepID=A0A1I7XMW6_HETBA
MMLDVEFPCQYPRSPKMHTLNTIIHWLIINHIYKAMKAESYNQLNLFHDQHSYGLIMLVY